MENDRTASAEGEGAVIEERWSAEDIDGLRRDVVKVVRVADGRRFRLLNARVKEVVEAVGAETVLSGAESVGRDVVTRRTVVKALVMDSQSLPSCRYCWTG